MNEFKAIATIDRDYYDTNIKTQQLVRQIVFEFRSHSLHPLFSGPAGESRVVFENGIIPPEIQQVVQNVLADQKHDVLLDLMRLISKLPTKSEEKLRELFMASAPSQLSFTQFRKLYFEPQQYTALKKHWEDHPESREQLKAALVEELFRMNMEHMCRERLGMFDDSKMKNLKHFILETRQADLLMLQTSNPNYGPNLVFDIPSAVRVKFEQARQEQRQS